MVYIKEVMELPWLSFLRIFGLLLVLVYHFHTDSLPGGFLGVDIFFTISGYLITAHLIHEFETTGTVRLFNFYKRRFRRLLPAVLFMLALMLPASLLISPNFRAGIDRQAAAVLGWVTNYYEIVTGSSYEAQLLPHLFVHTWTLGVDVHYYLIWGAVIRCFAFFCEQSNRSRSPVLPLRILAAAAAVASYLVMQKLAAAAEAASADPSRAYFATESHFYPLMIGSLTALFAGFRESRFTGFIRKLGVVLPVCLILLQAGGIGLLARMLNFENPAVQRWGIPAASLLAAGIISLLRGLRGAIGQEPAFFKYLANRSFSIYLFHWPLFIIIKQLPREPRLPAFIGDMLPSGAVIVAVSAILTAAFACLSNELVEKRFGKKAPGVKKNPAGRIIPASLCALLFFGCWYAVGRAPRKTTIEQDFEHEALLLSIDDLYQAAESFKQPRFDPIAQRTTEWLPSRPTIGWLPVIPNRSLNSDFGSITVIGDSVLLGGGNTLRTYIRNAHIDASGNRNIVQGEQIVTALKAEGKLGEYVVLVLSTNKIQGDVEAAENIVRNIGPGHRIIFVTGHGNKNVLSLNEAYHSLAKQYSYVTVANWDAAISPFEYLLSTDNIHMGDPASKRIFAQCIVNALVTAKAKPSS
ncbi:MAG: acyltransferase [Spirochaetaceae bacterium]|jgi:peptidoglycan/LPS O-acetylase OafA/YrhL|nr:acyltransferase [Spirochaetaceae bacterium]